MAEIKGVLLDLNLYFLKEHKKKIQNELYKTTYATNKLRYTKLVNDMKNINECINTLSEKYDINKKRKREYEVLRRRI